MPRHCHYAASIIAAFYAISPAISPLTDAAFIFDIYFHASFSPALLLAAARYCHARHDMLTRCRYDGARRRARERDAARLRRERERARRELLALMQVLMLLLMPLCRCRHDAAA